MGVYPLNAATKPAGATQRLPEPGNKKKKIVWKNWIPIYLLALPGLVYIFINNILPLYGMQLAFRELDYSQGIFNGEWVWFDNFKFLFKTEDAWIMTRNTVLYNLVFIFVGTIFNLAVAILFNEIRCKLAGKVYQSLVLIPHFMSMVIVSYLAFAFLSHENGFINNTILPLLGTDEIYWYNEGKYWPVILTVIHIWQGLGFSLLSYTARLLSIDPGYYEAAKIDGASKWQQIRTITLPLLKPVIIINITLALGRMFYSDFGLFYQVPMNSGPLYSATTTIDVYSYRALMKLGDVTMSSAVGVYQSFVGLILVLLANWAIRKVDRDNALF